MPALLPCQVLARHTAVVPHRRRVLGDPGSPAVVFSPAMPSAFSPSLALRVVSGQVLLGPRDGVGITIARRGACQCVGANVVPKVPSVFVLLRGLAARYPLAPSRSGTH
jgi:hypothetical protein